MSNNQTPDTTVVEIKTENNAPVDVIVKQSLLTRGKHFIKSHKRPTFAVAGLVSLVGASAYLGRKTAPTIHIDMTDHSIDINETEDGFEVVDNTDA